MGKTFILTEGPTPHACIASKVKDRRKTAVADANGAISRVQHEHRGKRGKTTRFLDWWLHGNAGLAMSEEL